MSHFVGICFSDNLAYELDRYAEDLEVDSYVVYTKEEAIFKWIINYFICLAMWIVETVICTIITNYLIPQNDLLRPYTYAYLIDSIYAVVIISVAAIMHMLSTLINLYKKGQILHIIVNILLVAFLAISVYCGGMGHDGSFVVALVLVNMCFIYNYCHKKCIP